MLKDVQSEEPEYPVIIDRVGIKNVKYPIRVLQKDNTHLNTVGNMSMFVSLLPGQRGTHMSRFIELLEKYKHDICGTALERMCNEMIDKLVTEYAQVKVSFPFFVRKQAPVTQKASLFDLTAGFSWKNDCDKLAHNLMVKAGVTSLCPCSKEMSKYGAHNQRAYVTIIVEPKHNEFIWFEDLVSIIDRCGSSPIYPLLKREDEKYVTEHAYDNPMFMEDVVRKVFHVIMEEYKDRIKYIKIIAESEESIHQHLAYAEIERRLEE